MAGQNHYTRSLSNQKTWIKCGYLIIVSTWVCPLCLYFLISNGAVVRAKLDSAYKALTKTPIKPA